MNFRRYGDTIIDFSEVSYCRLNPSDTRGEVYFCQFLIDGKIVDTDSEFATEAFDDFCEYAGVKKEFS